MAKIYPLNRIEMLTEGLELWEERMLGYESLGLNIIDYCSFYELFKPLLMIES